MQNIFKGRSTLCYLFILSVFVSVPSAMAQSKPQRVEPKTNEKRNERPKPKTAEELKAEEEERKRLEEEKNATPEEGVILIDTNVVNVEAVYRELDPDYRPAGIVDQFRRMAELEERNRR